MKKFKKTPNNNNEYKLKLNYKQYNKFISFVLKE